MVVGEESPECSVRRVEKFRDLAVRSGPDDKLPTGVGPSDKELGSAASLIVPGIAKLHLIDGEMMDSA
jgi:hypothetical protein